MRVLVIGSGGREHALAHCLAKSRSVSRVFAAPGNPGTAEIAANIDATFDDPAGLLDVAKREQVELVVVGPEAPLVRGVADLFRQAGIPVFGPGAAGAELEGSKIFAKDLMGQNGIPTAAYRSFDAVAPALAYLSGPVDFPVVVKASGLAAGKGVVICATRAEAEDAVKRLMVERVFGQAGASVVIESFLSGEEVSIHTLCDGRTFHTLPPSQDHKRLGDGDTGPNTGGMGAFSPAVRGTGKELDLIESQVVLPTVHALRKAGRSFRGVLYSGLMMTRTGPRVLEYNVRFGDPEAQVILPRLRGDLGMLLLACAEGRLKEVDTAALEVAGSAMIAVILASGGYPGAFEAGQPIEGIEDAARMPGVHIFHGGTARGPSGIVTAGGRVLAVAAEGRDLAEARTRAYAAAEKIHFKGMHYRRDIGAAAS